MSDLTKEDIIEEVLDLTELAVEALDVNNIEDIEIISGLVDCCDMANNLPNKRRRTEWVKPWRLERLERGSFSFLMNELSSDSSSFMNYIRMSAETFNYILGKIENDIRKKDTLMRKSISPAEKLAATLRYLATGESYTSTNYQTRLSNSFLSAAIPEVCEAIWKHFKDEYLKFPTTVKEWEAIAENFAMKWQFPLCLGALDGKHITFQSLRKDGSYFYNYKGTNSIVLLALVDADCRFIYIDVGCNGRTHDAGVLLQSSLKKVIDNADKYFPKDKVIGNRRSLPYVIIGDDAFPLQKHIMKPYSSNTNVKERRIYNLRLSRARHVVEHAFGIMSNRFRIFQKTMNLSVEKVELLTRTCCVLHNILSTKNEEYSNFTPQEVTTMASSAAKINTGKSGAQTIRQGFEEYFNNEGKLPWLENKL